MATKRKPKSDIEIARVAKMKPITEIAEGLGIPSKHIHAYGPTKGKITLDFIDSLKNRRNGKLILVTAITPTPAGEGKTTTSVGLVDGLNRIGKNAMICLREPSLGPCFGMKGGAAGGGYAQVVPMEDINLHFTGDFHAIGLAHNLLSAMVDNHLHHGNELGLDPKQILATAEKSARGGPFEAVFGDGDEIDPRVERRGLSLARMATLEETLEGVPQLRPTDTPAANSSFGYRRDPFTGRAAMHRGLDFPGPRGAPIYAAARGTVTFVGQKGGYGNAVEISHGQGLLTRYGHMSRFEAKVGDRVEAGTVIGAIGSTGRSTGPHLHFEVRVNGTAVNPRTFLELAPDVLKKVRRNSGAQRTRTASDTQGDAGV